ncbi:DUF115 domain-containing protein [Pararhizobium sp. LjRoot255]|uniref:6-hydroxymethylpterin diphosphokinase MptE-like protein n=1 Tax=Pararhizobium sp. LjRoot255 TaxID=3342298 RepID=UPI003ECFC1DC
MADRHFSLRELTPKRIVAAAWRRVVDQKEGVAWRYGSGKISREMNVAFKDIHRGQRCIIICNGPSINKTNMDLVKSEYSFCMNRSYLMFESWGFTPSFFVGSAMHVLRQFKTDILALPMPKFVDFKFRKLYPVEKDCYYLRLPPASDNVFVGDITLPMRVGGTVTYSALQLAYYMGFETVIIIGMDHRFSQQGVPSTSEVRKQEIDKDHMHPNYFPKGVKWELPDLVRSEMAYAQARAAYEKAGRRIIDATVDGACTIFEKATLENALRNDVL